ncbi:MAG: thiamine pyrophosphate-dependent enzyme, partial [Acidimicrobiia bacterium]
MTYQELPALMEMQSGDAKHERGATSTLDLLWVLYDRVLNVDATDPERADRDRFVLSKGHGPQAYYAVLAAQGFFPHAWLETYGRFDSPLGHHPDRLLIPGVEVSSGSLGHGLPIAVGITLALRSSPVRIVCLIGDGELDEGSNHEAIAFAGRTGLSQLSVVVVDNRSAMHGWPGRISERFALEGWEPFHVDGRDHDAIAAAFDATVS